MCGHGAPYVAIDFAYFDRMAAPVTGRTREFVQSHTGSVSTRWLVGMEPSGGGESWLSDAELKAVLVPCPADHIKMWAVDKRVGNVKNDDPELAEPMDALLL